MKREQHTEPTRAAYEFIKAYRKEFGVKAVCGTLDASHQPPTTATGKRQFID